MSINAFERKKIQREDLVVIPLECKQVSLFVSAVKAATGVDVKLVGGAIRQLVRTICWKGETPENVLLFLEQNLRDRDILADKVLDESLVQSLWAKYLPKAETELDIIVKTKEEYFEILDWHSNAVFYDGCYLQFLPLKEGEDYLCNDKDDDYLLLRGWINHHPIRGFDCFSDTFPLESLRSFYFPTYLKKLVELNKMYGRDDIFFAELETLYKSKRISKETYLAYKLGRESMRFLLLNNKEAILIVILYLTAFYYFLSSF